MPSRLHFIRSWMVVAIAVALLAFGATLTQAKPYWFESYQRAVQLIDADQAKEGSAILELLLQERPIPVTSLRIPGNQFIDYLPYYQQARAQAKLGQLEAASENLAVSESHGALTESNRHRKGHSELQQVLNVGDRQALVGS